jgi:hypothetical protein
MDTGICYAVNFFQGRRLVLVQVLVIPFDTDNLCSEMLFHPLN